MEEKINKNLIKYKNTVSIISFVVLLLAIPSIWPYGYYVLLRWIVAGSALYLVWVSYELEKKYWLFLMVVVSLLFNPFIPFHLDKETWVVIDIIVATLFLISIFTIKLKK